MKIVFLQWKLFLAMLYIGLMVLAVAISLLWHFVSRLPCWLRKHTKNPSGIYKAIFLLAVVLMAAGLSAWLLLQNSHRLKCGDSQCAFRGQCYERPAHSRCALNDPDNAWLCEVNYTEKDGQCLCLSKQYVCEGNKCGDCEKLKPSPWLPLCVDEESCRQRAQQESAQRDRYNQCAAEYNACIERNCVCN